MSSRQPTVAYLFTTFPKPTETFLQREVAAVAARGINLRLYSLYGGGGTFAGIRVERFRLLRLIELIWLIPWFALTRWDVLGILVRGLVSRRPPSWINFWENMLGAGFAGIYARHFRKHRPDLIHAAWSGAPATAAWILWRLNAVPFSAAAHAYDLYEHGGDWWLDEKLREARFIHTSTQMAAATLIARGHTADRVHVLRRGLRQFPRLKPLRPTRTPLRLVSVARLVPKKGLLRQLDIYRALLDAAVPFEAHVLGDGPLREQLTLRIHELGLRDYVQLKGHLAEAEVWSELEWADVLLHTGVVAPSGDRDGLPNVIPEAMAAGTLVLSSPVAGAVEAIADGITGFLINVDQPATWVERLLLVTRDDVLARRIQQTARQWTADHFDAARNVEGLANRFARFAG